VSRYYCWRVGGPVLLDGDGRCPECGAAGHDELPDDLCGRFVACPAGLDHGHPCALPPGHEGPCSAGVVPCAIAAALSGEGSESCAQ